MRMTFFVPVILVILLAIVSLTTRSSFAQGAGDACITKSGSAAPQGSHWYYRVDRKDHRHCWYLGPEGAKVGTPVRRRAESQMPPRLISPAPAEIPAQAAPAEITAGENGAAADFAMRWPNLLRSHGAVVREPPPASNSYAEQRAATDSQDDTPLVWPILTPADLEVAASPPLSAVNSWHMLSLLTGALAFAAMMVRSVFKRFAAGRLGRSSFRDQRRSAPDAPRPHRRELPAIADTVPVARHADVIRKSAAAARRDDVARQPPKPREQIRERQSDPAHDDIEESLRQLLRAWQRAAA